MRGKVGTAVRAYAQDPSYPPYTIPTHLPPPPVAPLPSHPGPAHAGCRPQTACSWPVTAGRAPASMAIGPQTMLGGQRMGKPMPPGWLLQQEHGGRGRAQVVAGWPQRCEASQVHIHGVVACPSTPSLLSHIPTHPEARELTTSHACTYTCTPTLLPGKSGSSLPCRRSMAVTAASLLVKVMKP
jgi:hypothetical protein